MTTDIMLDLETLSTAPDAAIVAIGACTFSTDGRTLTEGERRTFYAPVDLESSQRIGGRIEAATVRWWMAQSDAARQVFSGKEGIPLPAALLAFSAFCGTDDNIRIWGNGAAFDNIILRQAYQLCELPTPWKYAGDRCYRTLKALRDFGSDYLVKPAVAHNALSDALAQAATAERIFAEILRVGPEPASNVRRVRHKKRGTTYEVLGVAEAQVSASHHSNDRGEEYLAIFEGAELVVYRCEKTGELYLRHPDEFDDGRFEDLPAINNPDVEARKFHIGDRVRKLKGSSWQGVIVGFYTTSLTPIGYAVESEREPGSVQIYPENALEAIPTSEGK